MYEDCVEKFNCNRYPGHCSPACYRPIGQHNEPGVNSYKCCTCFPEVVEVFPMDRIWEGPAGRDGKDGASLEFAWEGTRLKVRVKGTEEWIYSTSLLGMQGPKGDTGEKGETGAIGPRGYTGAPGQDGDPGADGNGVDYVELHSSSGIIKTYRMHFTDGTYFDFTVTDGIDGINGQDGEGVVEGGTTGQVLKKKSNDDFDTEWVDYAYDDLSGRPKINNITLSGNKSLSDLGIKQTYNKTDVGLGNVDNIRQYSVNNPPPYPVTSVNGNTGAVVIDTHDDLIPTQASSSNKLATEGFVNSTVATSTATFRGTYDSLVELEQVSADENDYGFVVDVDSDGNTVYNRYKYASGTWTFEYALNNSSFTAAQWEAIQSGITDNLVTKLQGIEAGAEVNIVEGLKIGNVTQQVSSKIVQINPDTTPMQGSNNVIDSNAVYEVEKLLPTDRESGENVDIDNAQPYKVLDVVADGKYQQNTTTGKNLFNKNDSGINNDKRISTGTGSVYTSNGYSSSPYIEVEANTRYTLTSGISSYYCWYNENKEKIVGGTWDTGNFKTSYEDAKYVRFDFSTSDIDSVMFEQGSEASPYEPYTGGIPSPNPNYPQTITTITSMTWNRCGKNLWSSEWEQGKIDGTTGQNAASSVSVRTKGYIAVQPNQHYSIQRSITTQYIQVRGYNKNKTFLGTGSDVLDLIYGQTAGNPMKADDSNCIISPKEGVYYLRINDVSNDLSTKYMMVKGDYQSGLVYEPYNGQSIEVNLDGNEVCATDTIKDKLLVDRYGNVALQKNAGKHTISTTTSSVTINEMASNGEFVSTVGGTISGKTITFLSSVSSGTIYYELATPTIISLPKLSVLPSTLKGINHIWVDTNLATTDIEVEYVEDLSLAIPTSVTDLTDGANYVKNTDYATNNIAGVVKWADIFFTNVNNTGQLQAKEKTYAQYNSASNSAFIGKGTLENVLAERIGTIETALTTLDVGSGV